MSVKLGIKFRFIQAYPHIIQSYTCSNELLKYQNKNITMRQFWFKTCIYGTLTFSLIFWSFSIQLQYSIETQLSSVFPLEYYTRLFWLNSLPNEYEESIYHHKFKHNYNLKIFPTELHYKCHHEYTDIQI